MAVFGLNRPLGCLSLPVRADGRAQDLSRADPSVQCKSSVRGSAVFRLGRCGVGGGGRVEITNTWAQVHHNLFWPGSAPLCLVSRCPSRNPLVRCHLRSYSPVAPGLLLIGSPSAAVVCHSTTTRPGITFSGIMWSGITMARERPFVDRIQNPAMSSSVAYSVPRRASPGLRVRASAKSCSASGRRSSTLSA